VKVLSKLRHSVRSSGSDATGGRENDSNTGRDDVIRSQNRRGGTKTPLSRPFIDQFQHGEC
jgi:hypothetical protein